MLLKRLVEYSERIPSTPAMYGKMIVRWYIDLDEQGNLVSLTPAKNGSRKNQLGVYHYTPHIGRAFGIKPKLLADNGEYVLGLAREGSDAGRVRQCHKAFTGLVSKAADFTQEKAVRAVLRFLQEFDSHQSPLNLSNDEMSDEFDPAHNVTFRVNGVFPVDLPSVQLFWSSYSRGQDAGKSKEGNDVDTMQCLICGEEKPPVRRLPFKIKRIPGGQQAGMALISANSAAFESYGLRESFVSPTCRDCGEKFSKAVNSLLEDEKARIIIGRTVYVFWTNEDVGFSFASLITAPDSRKVKALIKKNSAVKGSPSTKDLVPLYAAAFSASGARVAVRDWVKTTVGEAGENLARWFEMQRLGDGGARAPYVPLKGYLRKDGKWVSGIVDDLAPLSKGRRDLQALPPRTVTAVVNSALKGSPLPLSLLSQAVRRNRLERKVTRPRAVLIKMVLLSRGILSDDEMEDLIKTAKLAYLCGRLLGILEQVQIKAINPEITIVHRFYATASTAPRSVFGRLVSTAYHQLTRLRREKRSAYEMLSKQMEEVNSMLDVFPLTLTLEEQGLFALGYYRQKTEAG